MLVTKRFNRLNNILFSDEAHFDPNGHVNKENYPYSRSTNPQRIR